MINNVARVLVLTILLVPNASSQILGEITGVVTDSSGGVLAGAVITVTNPQTNFSRQTTTNHTGGYSFPALQPGVYNVRSENPGFQSAVRNSVELQVQQTARIDFVLQVGQVTETVEVTGGAPLLNTESATVGTVIENRRILDLPLNGRNFTQLVALSPNVSVGFTVTTGGTTGGPNIRQGGERSEQSLSVSGQPREFTNFSLDGMANTDPNYNTYLFRPSVDALQEFKVQTGMYSAEFGRGVAQVNVMTKSGTNEFHGALFEFLRNDAVDARPYAFTSVVPEKAPFKWNQFGATIGGPIARDRVFFLANYEGFRQRSQAQGTRNVPSLAMRSGDFSQLLPNTILRDPRNRIDGVKQVFPGNIIPVTWFHPVSVKLLEFILEPNVPGTTGLTNNFFGVRNHSTDTDQLTARVDLVEHSNSNWFFRYGWSDEADRNPGLRYEGTNRDADLHQIMVSNQRILSPTVVNEFRFGFSDFFNARLYELANERDVMTELGIQLGDIEPSDWGVPAISFTGFSGIGPPAEGPYRIENQIYQVVDNLTWTRGAHSLKFGAEIRRDHFNTYGNLGTRGNFVFQNQATGYGFSDLMGGYIQANTKSFATVRAPFRATGQYYYINDNWKIRPNLTVDMGLRYEFTPPWSSRDDMLSNAHIPIIVYTPGEGAATPHPTLIRVGSGDFYERSIVRFAPDLQVARDGRLGSGDRVIDSDYNDFAPRLGLAWSPTAQWTIRAGAGVFYSQGIGTAVFDIGRNMAGRGQTSANLQANDLTWDDPYGLNFSNPCGTIEPLVCVVSPGILSNQVDRRTPYTIQYNLNMQRQLADSTVFEIGYLGSQSHNLQTFHNLNQAVPGSGAPALRRPWPESGVFQHVDGIVNANYHSLTGRLQRRMSSGFTYLLGYTFSKAIDNGDAVRQPGQQPQNSACWSCERALSVFDLRHRFVASALFELPFGRGRRFLDSGGVANALLGGWQLSSIFSVSSGTPFGISTGTSRSGSAGAGYTDRPNATGEELALDKDQRSNAQWFNIHAVRRNDQFTFGNVGRHVGVGPGILGWDFALLKNFHFTESKYLQFRFEGFNTMNHPNFGNPGGSLSSNQIDSTGLAIPGTGNFGVIDSVRGEMRRLQFGLKFVF